MLAHVQSAAVIGLDAVPVDVEVDVSPGIPAFAIVGLPDAAVREARERVRAAVRNAGYEMPPRRITVNLAPADTRKEGPAFDLPIALGVLAATQQIPHGSLDGLVVVGELSLDGGVRPVSGVLSIALAAQQWRRRGLIAPEANAREATIVEEMDVYPATSLRALARALYRAADLSPAVRLPPAPPAPAAHGVDFAEVRGQGHPKRAIEIAAAGAHNLLLLGPPGSGKTMLAQRLPTVLPPLTHDEAIEVTRIYSVGGRLTVLGSLISARPFRAPHHAASVAALVGGGPIPRPGEVSLAHLGVLFLDELPEFRRDVLEALRQPLEEGRVAVARAHGTVIFPARCMLVAAMNPCPCGYLGDPVRPCLCSPLQRLRYLGRISGPLLDRMDLHVEVPRLPGRSLASAGGGEPSAAIAARVLRARAIQAARGAQGGTAGLTNGAMPPAVLHRSAALREGARRFLQQAIDRLGLSPRSFERIVRVARTIADLEESCEVEERHVAEAVTYRSLDRPLAAVPAGVV